MKSKPMILAFGIAIGFLIHLGINKIENGGAIQLFPSAEAASTDEPCAGYYGDGKHLMPGVNDLYRKGYRVQGMAYTGGSDYMVVMCK